MFGYIEIYFKLENETKVAYSKYDSDFTLPITEDVFKLISDSVKTIYETELKVQFDTITPCTKEEYLNDGSDEALNIKW